MLSVPPHGRSRGTDPGIMGDKHSKSARRGNCPAAGKVGARQDVATSPRNQSCNNQARPGLVGLVAASRRTRFEPSGTDLRYKMRTHGYNSCGSFFFGFGETSMYVMQPYDIALQDILENGSPSTNVRTGVKTRAIIGMLSRFRIDEYIPVLTRRKVWPKAVFAELLWFLSGSTNNNDLHKLGASFWDQWDDPQFQEQNGFVPGSFGPVYGFQLRHFGGDYCNGDPDFEETVHKPEWEETFKYGEGGVDQLAYVIGRIKADPSCRRILWSLWNPKDLDKMKLPPCHDRFQVCIDDLGRMTGHLTMRSSDYPIGVPANIQFYSTLTHMLAQQTGYKAHEFVLSTVHSHIYENQIEGVKAYLATPIIDSPKLILKPAEDIYSYTMEHFELEGFTSGPKITMPVAV